MPHTVLYLFIRNFYFSLYSCFLFSCIFLTVFYFFTDFFSIWVFTDFLDFYPINVLLFFWQNWNLKSLNHMYRQIQPAFSLSQCCSFLGLICVFQTITNSNFLFFFSAEILNVLPNLEVLDLSINKHIGCSMKVIAQDLKNVPGLKELNLHMCGLKQDSLQGLGQTLHSESLSFCVNCTSETHFRKAVWQTC